MKPSPRLVTAGVAYAMQLPPDHRKFIKSPGPGTSVKRLAKRFMAFRAAKLAADPSVDTFFNRGESAARFAYFDE